MYNSIMSARENFDRCLQAWRRKNQEGFNRHTSLRNQFEEGRFGTRLSRTVIGIVSQLSQIIDKHPERKEMIINCLNRLAQMFLFGGALAKRMDGLRFNAPRHLIQSRIMHKLLEFNFGEHRRQTYRPLAVLLEVICGSHFIGQRQKYKPLILRALSECRIERRRYIKFLSQIVTERNITPLEMESYELFTILVESTTGTNPISMVRHSMNVITGFCNFYPVECIGKFYKEGLLQQTVLPIVKPYPLLIKNFLEKIHGVDFSTRFPHKLTQEILQLINQFDPEQQQQCFLVVIQIGRYRLVDLVSAGKLRQIDILTPIEDGLITKMYLILHRDSQLSLKQQVYRFIKDLLIVVSKGMKELLFVIINVMIREGMLEQARDDQNNIDLRDRASAVYQMLDATDEFWNVWESLNLFEQFP